MASQGALISLASLTPCNRDRTAVIKRGLHLHRTVAIFIATFSPIERLAVDLHQNRGSGESRSFPHLNFNRTAYGTRGRTPRSRSDRTAITARSSRDLGTYDVESSPVNRQAIDEGSGPRSWPDRGPIVARSWRDCGPIVAEIAAIWKPN